MIQGRWRTNEFQQRQEFHSNTEIIKAMNPPQASPQPCHNCRRRRLKCDRSLPHCFKCIKRGQECLGYECLLRWEDGIASRGKMAGTTFGDLKKHRATQKNSSPHFQSPSRINPFPLRDTESSSLRSLTDPLIQDIDYKSRKYLSYCGPTSPSGLIIDNC